MTSICRLCGSPNCKPVCSLGKQPMANKYPKSKFEFANEVFFEMILLHCAECLSVQIERITSRDEMFLDYYYLSSVNAELVQHFDALANKISDKKFVVDVGSNDGILLRPLKKLGVKAVGIDPSKNVGGLANESGLQTIIGYFDKSSASEIIQSHGKPDCIVASSVFTHLDDVPYFIETVKSTLSEDGVLIIEVEYLPNIINKLQFERFYFDRPNYFSLTTLVNIFEKHDMYVDDVEMVAPHGGSIRAYIKHGGSQLGANNNVKKVLQQEQVEVSGRHIGERFNAFQTALNDLLNTIKTLKNEGNLVCGYGAPARLSTITNFGKITAQDLPFVIDDSPLKQGRYSPGVHIPILPFSQAEAKSPDVLIVFAYEYLTSIVDKTKHLNSRYFTPIPVTPIELV